MSDLTEPMQCAAGHHWQARLRPSRLGDCRQSGVMIVVEGADICPECGLLPGLYEYCHVCDEPLTQARVLEIALAADRPDQLLPRDWLCKAHADSTAGGEVRPCEVGDEWDGTCAAIANALCPRVEVA